jgi:glycolate oxidase iron-sulfur subunit
VTHIDRCLSCLACTTTCPSGVDYAQLIDHARAHIEIHYDRPWREQLLRDLIPAVLTRPRGSAGAAPGPAARGRWSRCSRG